jgi:phage-related protein (TIGR01555 family)
LIARAKTGKKRRAPPTSALDPFKPYAPPKGVVPEGEAILAMDEAGQPGEMTRWLASMSFTEGLQFLGYPYLAELSQRGEYRKAVDVLATEMTREWIEFEAVGGKDKTAKISKIEHMLNEELRAPFVFAKVLSYDGQFGRGHLYLDTGDTEDLDELVTPIGSGRDSVSKMKVNPDHPLLALRAVEPVWAYPTTYNANNPLKPDWYKPSIWYVMSTKIHATRFLTLITREVSDMLKPAYSFGGVALNQLIKPAVDNWLQVRSGVADLITSFTVFHLATNMSARIQMGGDEELFKRAEFFAAMRDNRGVFLTDKDTEEFDNVSAPLGTLDALQAQSQEHVATLASLPLVKYVGDQPAGLNASSEGAIRMFYDWILSQQNAYLKPMVQVVVDLVQLSLFGEVDEDITFRFKPLFSLNEKEQAEVDKSKAETHQIYVDLGAVSNAEVRACQVNDPHSPYRGLDPDDAPDLLKEEEEGLEPVGGRPDPELTGEKPAEDAQWNEVDHARAANGQFTSGGGGEKVAKLLETLPTKPRDDNWLHEGQTSRYTSSPDEVRSKDLESHGVNVLTREKQKQLFPYRFNVRKQMSRKKAALSKVDLSKVFFSQPSVNKGKLAYFAEMYHPEPDDFEPVKSDDRFNKPAGDAPFVTLYPNGYMTSSDNHRLIASILRGDKEALANVVTYVEGKDGLEQVTTKSNLPKSKK